MWRALLTCCCFFFLLFFFLPMNDCFFSPRMGLGIWNTFRGYCIILLLEELLLLALLLWTLTVTTLVVPTVFILSLSVCRPLSGVNPVSLRMLILNLSGIITLKLLLWTILCWDDFNLCWPTWFFFEISERSMHSRLTLFDDFVLPCLWVRLLLSKSPSCSRSFKPSFATVLDGALLSISARLISFFPMPSDGDTKFLT